ncbi:nucleotidyltransferase family protein [bacterium]|nr:nucleotidyltransferase family protein [bacterium]
MDKNQVIATLKANMEKLQEFPVNALYIFGSVARDDADKSSDIDMLVEFEQDAHIGLFGFARLQRALSDILSCQVDLVTPEALHKEMKDRILEEAVRAA